jgi:hypothetical protein
VCNPSVTDAAYEAIDLLDDEDEDEVDHEDQGELHCEDQQYADDSISEEDLRHS